MRTLPLVAMTVVMLAFTAAARAHWTPHNPVHLRRHAVNLAWCGGTERWCAYGTQAWLVAGCESGPQRSPWARNGSYYGAFQMGSYARAAYGHGWNIWVQARAAHRYWLAAGWAPWTCAYLIGIR